MTDRDEKLMRMAKAVINGMPADAVRAMAELHRRGMLQEVLDRAVLKAQVSRALGEMARAELRPIIRSLVASARDAERRCVTTICQGAVNVRRSVARPRPGVTAD